MNSKLIKELQDLVKNQVISQEIASKIEAYYQSNQDEKPNRLFTVFGVLGSLLVGLGIILMLAHNWDDFSRTTKTIFAFLPLVIGQLLVGYSILKKKNATWRESSGTFLFFTVGSSIALVAQIYNIPSSSGTFLLTWIVLCLPLIYLLKSNALVILHIVYATSYAFEVGYFIGDNSPWLYVLLMALIMPYYLRLLTKRSSANITSIINWLIPMSLTIVLGAFITVFDELVFLSYIILFGLFYNIGKIPFFNTLKLRQNGYLVLGSFGSVVLLLIASFRWIWDDVLHISKFVPEDSTVVIALFIIASIVLGYLFLKKQVKTFNLFHFVYIMMTILFFIGLANDVTPTVVTNILLFILGINAIKIGADKFHFGILNYGLLIITALVVCRFFDTNMSYVIRGLLFVAVGVGFFVTNYIMLKKQKEKNQIKANN
jgi:uncharacterized membrane protein